MSINGNFAQMPNASEMYDKMSSMPYMVFGKSEIYAVNNLAIICEAMKKDYEQIVDDETEYILDIQEQQQAIEVAQAALNDEIENLENRRIELTAKYADGTITDEEYTELKGISGEIDGLAASADSKIEASNNSINNTVVQSKNVCSKREAAEDYGNVTLEKGQPLAETEVKGGFFRKLFGKTGKNKKEAGERAVKAGTELLQEVGVSVELEAEIDKYGKKSS